MARRWILDRAYEALGTRFRLRTEDPEVGARVQKLFAPFRAPGDEPVPAENTFALLSDGRQRELLRGSTILLRTPQWPRLIGLLVSEINETVLDGFSGLAAHAGVVAMGQRVIAFPATSGGGKSTLTAACMRAGFSYVSDEALCLDLDTGRVIPYPKPLGLTEESRKLLGIGVVEGTSLSSGREALLTADELEGGDAEGDLRLAELVLAERNGQSARLQPLPSAEIVTTVLRFSFNHYKHPERSFRLLVDVAKRCRAWRVVYREPAGAAAALRDAFG